MVFDSVIIICRSYLLLAKDFVKSQLDEVLDPILL